MVERAALRQTLKELLEDERGETYPSLDESAGLREQLGLDSVDLVSLVLRIQDQFRVVLPSDELERVSRVGDLLDLLQAKLAARAA
jgi:acyl carrier protein